MRATAGGAVGLDVADRLASARLQATRLAARRTRPPRAARARCRVEPSSQPSRRAAASQIGEGTQQPTTRGAIDVDAARAIAGASLGAPRSAAQQQ